MIKKILTSGSKSLPTVALGRRTASRFGAFTLIVMHFKIILILIFIAFGANAADESLNLEKIKAYHAFQKDADIIRLQHLNYYGSLINEYKEKTGMFPFMSEANIPLYVHLASPEQEEFAKMKPPYEHKFKTVEEFINLIESGVGREIEEQYDPQYRPDFKPNFYIYMAHKGTYFFAVHLHQEYLFSEKISKNYNKVEISNNPNSTNHARDPNKLFTSKEFIDAVNKPISKPAFFKEREQKFLHATKQ